MYFWAETSKFGRIMRLLIDGEYKKIQNFVEFLIENYCEKGKTYEFEIHVDDRYDKKLLENRENSLQENILVMHDEGFEILSPEYMSDLGKFKAKIKQLLDKEYNTSEFTLDNFVEQFVHYKIRFVENESEHHFHFSYINLSV
jgi:hypothetical protein